MLNHANEMFSKSVLRPFRPLSTPLPVRQPCVLTCDSQLQSPFLSHLPAEVRNAIYQYVFTPTSAEPDFASAHPLSLLLTCLKINREASILAFHHTTFALARNDRRSTFIAKRNFILHLSTAQINAITALSYDIRRNYTKHQNDAVASIICKSILLFPNLARFEIRILHGRKKDNKVRDTVHQRVVLNRTRDIKELAANEYAPKWFREHIVQRIADRPAHAWQEGEHWQAQWPQLEDQGYLDMMAGNEADESNRFAPNMSINAVGNVRGVHMCPCSRGKVCWTSVDLIQQTGRTVAIDTVLYGKRRYL
jgi:hypothetical protein